ncbi:cation_ATPase_N domain-containing protein, partial [Haematococcus lacustris]
MVRVVRAGVERSISTFELLVGDVLVLETGDIVAADGLLVLGEELRVDESHLTGESEDVLKSVSSQAVLLLSGSKVLEGYGHMLVLAVGPNSQAGILNQLVRGAAAGLDTGAPSGSEERAVPAGVQTFLTRKLDTLATRIGAVGVAAAVAVFVVNGGRYVLDTLDGGAAAGLPLAQHV